MARIKIKDIPKDQKISKEELMRIRGGAAFIKAPSDLLNLTSLKIEVENILDSRIRSYQKVV